MDWNTFVNENWNDLTAEQWDRIEGGSEIELDVEAAQLFEPGSVAMEITK